MKNAIFPIFTFILVFHSLAQVPGFKKTDLQTATIEGYEVNVGDTLQLGFGSGANGEFIFIAMMGKGLIASAHTSAGMSNQAIVVDFFSELKNKNVYGVPELTTFCKPVFGVKGRSFKFWFVPQLKNAILKGEIIWDDNKKE